MIHFCLNSFLIVFLAFFSLSVDGNAAAPEFRPTAFFRPPNYFKPVWTKSLHAELKRHKKTFENAQDIESYCPGYWQQSEQVQLNCWFRIATGIMAFESHFKERVVGDRGKSFGLMQIQAGNCKAQRINGAMLRQAKYNFRCGADLMAFLIERDRYIGLDKQKCSRRTGRCRLQGYGLSSSRGWTTMRIRKNTLRNGMAVGHQEKIRKGVRTYTSIYGGTFAFLYRLVDRRDRWA